ncbi:MAG TPA: mevalonate kinase, partial [Gammaproteobacteria bacterium]|nr:mevalonate kinase [Gammaproteobacteria bacterium]
EVLNVRPTQGLKIKVQSDIPMGCGLGSSAALILAVMHVIAKHLKLSLSPEVLFRMALEVENLQHGYSSGLDLRIAQQGGCLLMKEDEVLRRAIPPFPFYLINTGTPLCSTGECVSQVEPFFRSRERKENFAAVTAMMDQALEKQAYKNFHAALLANHRLLNEIGVVPLKVQNCIAEIEQQGGAAKICGAGAISGEQAGMVLAVVDEVEPLIEICARYHYTLMPASADERGVHVV